MATAGLLAFASCQEKAGYTIKGTIEGVAEGDTVYLQNFVDGSLVKNGFCCCKRWCIRI